MQIVIRRAEARDAAGIEVLTKDASVALKKRFGAANSVPVLIDTAPLSFVATDPLDSVVFGFCAFSNGPPPFVDNVIASTGQAATGSGGASDTPEELVQFGRIAQGNWEKWLYERYESKNITTQNAKFLSFFVSYPDHQSPFLDAALSAVFSLLPNVVHICYLLPDVLTLFPPLSSLKFVPHLPSDAQNDDQNSPVRTIGTGSLETPVKKPLVGSPAAKKPASGNSNGTSGENRPVYFTEVAAKTGEAFAPFALQVCTKKDVFPVIKIRKGRIEDCDDLVPMLEKQSISLGKKTDQYLAELLDTKSDKIRTLVAEVGTSVVGFMCLTGDVDQSLLVRTFELSIFDNLIKEASPDLLATAAGEHIKPIAVGPEGTLMDPHVLAASYNAIHDGSDPIRAALEASTAEGRAVEKAAGMIAAQQAAAEQVQIIQAQCNIFCISLLCIEDMHANHGIEFVKAAFSLFPDRDYCVVTVPSGMPEIPVLRNFTMVHPRPGNMSKFGCTETVTVRNAQPMDFLTVQEVIQDIPAEYDILIRFNESFEDSESGVPINKEYKAFIAETNGQAVGVAVLEKFTFASTVSDQFDIEEFVNLDVTPLDGQHLLLRHMILNPFFMQQSRWFTEEIMRMAGVSCMLYMVDETSKSDVCTKALMSKQFIPVNRRKQIIFEDNLRDGVSVSEQLPFNIQIITNSFLYEPKLEVNTKIVVVGGSDTGIAFLEKLIYTTHLHFSNITLISTAGVPSKLNSESFVDHKCYSNIDLKQIGLEHYIRIVQASTTELDRVLKRVRLDDDSFISYDYLFLTPGVQFFSSSINEDFSNLNGVFNLNPRSYASYMQASMKLLGRDDAQTGRIVIYGRDLQVFVTFQELIKKGISPSWIVVVIPPPTEPTNCFDNATVENMVLNRLTSVGAQVLIDFKVSQWRSSPSGALESVAFLRKFDKLEIAVDQAEVFLYGDLKSVDPDTFMSINDSCLVFDAKLVIDKFCRTQDPYVFAAGSITKFSSRYQTKWTHGYLDSKEVGKKLAEIVLPLFDPTKISPSLEDNNKVVKFADAKKKYAVLPGNLVYLHFDEPRLPSHSFEFVKKQANYGRDLVINTDTLGYFRIRVDPFGFIRSLTYLGERRIPVENYLCLYGLNEKYLNGLVSRFDEGIISDFVRFA
ncbi:hypothetical protein HDU84_006860 [Entophlyctis sp. JEL0112]|nr:hypothetical protein HDU84_006860 [Entophlyctis sp. JEL0112]